MMDKLQERIENRTLFTGYDKASGGDESAVSLFDKDGTLHMKQLPSWHDVNLHWTEDESNEEKDNIVEVDFKHDDKG